MASERQFIVLPAQALKDPRLDAPAKLVLMALASHADKHGICWPSVETLAAETSYSERSVKRALQLLEETGRIERIRRRRPLTALTRIVYDTPTSELIAAYAAAGGDFEDDKVASEGLDADDQAPLDENKKGHHGPSGAGEGSRSATVAPPEGPQGPVELGAVELNCSSSSPHDTSTEVVKGHADAEPPVPAAAALVPGSRVGENVAPPAASPAALRAPTSPARATTPPVEADAAPVVGISDRFTDPDQRAVYLAYRRSHRFPPAFDAELKTLTDPITSSVVVPWAVIGRQLLQLAGNGAEFNARLFAGYCRSAMEARSKGDPERPESVPPARSRARGADRSTATRSAFLELVDKTKERAS